MQSTTAVLLLAITAPAWAQIAGPVVGLVVDANSNVRPVLGVPGAASLGAALPFDPSIQVIGIGPHQDYVLGLQGGRAVVLNQPIGSVPVTAIPGTDGTASAILSPTGSAALLVPGFQVVTGLPSSPAIAWTIDPRTIPGSMALFAVSDDGTAVVSGGGGSVSLLTANGGPRALAWPGQAGGLSFVPGTTDVLYTDMQANQGHVISGGVDSVLGDASAGLSMPTDIEASEDGTQVFIENTNPAGVLAINRASGTSVQVNCACQPMGLTRMGSAPVFRLTDPAAGLFWIFDGVSQRVLAVPPGANQ